MLLLFDDASFTLYNQAGKSVSITGISFRSANGYWNADNWGPGLARNFPEANCLRLRDATKGQRQPPAICGGNLYGLQLVGSTALFWRNVEQFEVVRDGEIIATCRTKDERCLLYIP